MWFSPKKEPIPAKIVEKPTFEEEYIKISKRLLDVEQRVLGLELSEKQFRDKVLRKMQRPQYEEEQQEVQQMGVKMFGGRG
jgi:hypothetical protein